MTDQLCPTCRSPLRFARAIFSPATGDYGEIWRCTNCGREIERPDGGVPLQRERGWPYDDPEAPDTLIVTPSFREDFLRRARGNK